MSRGPDLAALTRRLSRNGRSAQPQPGGASKSELAIRREELATKFAQAQWDLGGLAYEMARRDHFRMDVLVKQAARLQTIDAELGEVEHLLTLEQAAAAGACRSCGALYAHGAVFCWQCGESLVTRAHVEGRIAEG